MNVKWSDEEYRSRLKAMRDLEVQELLKPVKPKRKDYYAARIKRLEASGKLIVERS